MWERPTPRAVVTFAVAVAVLIWKGPTLLTALRVDELQTTTGRVIEAPEVMSSLGANRTQVHRVILEYEYEIAGERYTGDNIGLFSNEYPTRDRAVRFAEHHGEGREVTVHYDPADPARACLSPPSGPISGGTIFWIGGVVVALGFSAWYAWCAILEHRAI